MAAATRRQPLAFAAAGEPAAQAMDPKFEWTEKAGSYVLRLALPGFRKNQFRVQVDGAGRLTVRGARPGTAGQSSFSKVFQLPASASLDDIAGRFEAGVLTLTVTKRASSSPGAGVAPTSIEDIMRKQPGVAKDTKPKEEETAKEDASKKKAMDEATEKARLQQKQEEEASQSKQEQQKQAPAQVKKEEVKPKAPQPATAPPQKPTPVKKEEEMKQKTPKVAPATPPTEKLAPKPGAATGANKAKPTIAPESLAERVRRRSEEEGANAATIAPAKRAKTDGEKKATAACIGWKERVQGELKVLTDMKWADGMVEAAKKNKEVVALGIAAFSLGLIVTHRLLKK